MLFDVNVSFKEAFQFWPGGFNGWQTDIQNKIFSFRQTKKVYYL